MECASRRASRRSTRSSSFCSPTSLSEIPHGNSPDSSSTPVAGHGHLSGSHGAHPGRPGTLRAIEAALKAERLVFAVAQRDNTDEPTPDILYSMGVIARIGQIQRGLGGVQLLLQGEQRATSLQYTTTEGYLSAVVMPVDEMKPANENDPAFVALNKELRERAAELGERRGLPEEVVHQVLDAVTDPGRFADLV